MITRTRLGALTTCRLYWRYYSPVQWSRRIAFWSQRSKLSLTYRLRQVHCGAVQPEEEQTVSHPEHIPEADHVCAVLCGWPVPGDGRVRSPAGRTRLECPRENAAPGVSRPQVRHHVCGEYQSGRIEKGWDAAVVDFKGTVPPSKNNICIAKMVCIIRLAIFKR